MVICHASHAAADIFSIAVTPLRRQPLSFDAAIFAMLHIVSLLLPPDAATPLIRYDAARLSFAQRFAYRCHAAFAYFTLYAITRRLRATLITLRHTLLRYAACCLPLLSMPPLQALTLVFRCRCHCRFSRHDYADATYAITALR